MKSGWIKLHRKVLENPIFSSEKGFRLWIWCLLKAGHKEKDVYLGNEKIHLKEGEFIFGRGSASEQLGIKESTIRNWMKTLKQDRYIDIKPTNKYSLIKVRNWEQYQDTEQGDGQQSKNKLKTKQKQMDTNKNDKNDKNDKEYNSMSPIKISDQSNIELSKLLFKKILKNNPNFKEPNINKWSDDFRKMKEIDRRTDEQIKYLILWSQSNDFWHKNILSPIKLRKHFDRLIVEVRSNKSNNKISKGVRIC